MKNKVLNVSFLQTAKLLHPVYQSLAKSSPDNWRIINATSYDTQYVSLNIKDRKGSFFRRMARYLGRLPIPTFMLPKRSSIRPDVFLALQTIPVSREKYILDIDFLPALNRFHQKSFDSSLNQLILRSVLHSERCLGIAVWSERAKRSVEKHFPHVSRKTHVVYPAIKPSGPFESNYDVEKRFNLLFVGTDFERKGGVETVLAFREIRKVFPQATLTLVSKVPNRYLDLVEGTEGIKWTAYIPRDELYEKVFPAAGIFIMPTLRDIFGFVFLEAMSFAMPSITLADFATGEIITDGVDGYVIDSYQEKWFSEDGLFDSHYRDLDDLIGRHSSEERSRIVADIAERSLGLMHDGQLYEQMCRFAYEKVASGKFSVSARNAALSKFTKDFDNSS